MALQSSGAISFADINTEMNNTSTDQLDLQTAGQGFQLDVDSTNWSDSTAGLSMSEFYGLDYDDINYNSGGGTGGGTGSDRRMKKNIILIGKSESGLNIYSFEYINKVFGEGVWQGVMSDEVPNEAVIKNFAGDFDGVDYSKVDVEFKRID